MIKFNLYNVVNTDNGNKARVNYCLDNDIRADRSVTLYGKTVLEDLCGVFGNEEVDNDSDSMTDYYESDSVTLFENSKYYEAAREAAERLKAKRGY